MNLFRGPNATGLTPRLCATTLPLFAFSCVSLDAQQPPWEGCRAASKTEYESAKRDFLLQTSVGAYAMRAFDKRDLKEAKASLQELAS